jgi:hypothetical protein
MSPHAEVFVPQAHSHNTSSQDAMGPRVPSPPPAKDCDHLYARPAGQSVIHAPPYDNPESPNPFLNYSPPNEIVEKKTPTTITGFYLGTTKVGETAALSGGEACVWATLHDNHLVFVPRPKDEHPISGMWGNRSILETNDFEKCHYSDIKFCPHLMGIPTLTLNNLCMSILKQPSAKNGFLFKFD